MIYTCMYTYAYVYTHKSKCTHIRIRHVETRAGCTACDTERRDQYIYTYMYTHNYIYACIIYIYIQNAGAHAGCRACEHRAVRPTNIHVYVYTQLIYTHMYTHNKICTYIYVEPVNTQRRDRYIYTYMYAHNYIYAYIIYVHARHAGAHAGCRACDTERRDHL